MPIIRVTHAQMHRLRAAIDELDPNEDWSASDWALASIEESIKEATT